MAAVKVLVSRLSKAQKAQLKKMEAEARQNGSGATTRDHLAILLNDPSIAIQPKRGRKSTSACTSPGKKRKRGTGPITQATKRERAGRRAAAGRNQNFTQLEEPQASKPKKGQDVRRAKGGSLPQPELESEPEMEDEGDDYSMPGVDNEYEEYLPSHSYDGEAMDHAEDYMPEDHGNRSVLQLTTAISSIMDDVDEEDDDEQVDLARVLIDYRVLGESKVIRNTTLAAATSFTQFKRIISKLMGSQDPDEMSLAYQISISVAKPPTGISTAIDEAKDYTDMISGYQEKVKSRDEREKRSAKKSGGKVAESKPYQIWVFDTRPKLTKGKGGAQSEKKGKAGATDWEDGSKNEPSGSLEFMGEVRNNFPCTNHRSGHPCYPTAEGCHRFTSAQLSFWNFLANVKKIDEFGNPYTAAKIPTELGITAAAKAQQQRLPQGPTRSTSTSGPLDPNRLRVPSTQPDSRATSPHSSTALPNRSPHYGNLVLPTAPPSSINYPKLSEWLKGLDSNPARVREDQKFGLDVYVMAFKEYGWEKLDDLLDSSVNAQLLVEVIEKGLCGELPLKPGSAAALLRWAKQDAKALEEGTSFRLLGDLIANPHWSR